jgi:exonuclease III
MQTVKIASININCMSKPTKVGMLEDFLHRHDIDIIFVQEETNQEMADIRGYVTHINIGTNMR